MEELKDINITLTYDSKTKTLKYVNNNKNYFIDYKIESIEDLKIVMESITSYIIKNY